MSIEDWKPEENKCHENVTIWCQHETTHKPVRGWLYFDLGGILDFVWFNAHSAIETAEGKLFDITPANTSQQYPFVIAEESEEDFAALVEGNGILRLEHYL